MKSDKLYRVEREDLPKLEQLLYRCFAHDPLYETLIPDAGVRKRLMPELFQCDMDEFYEIIIIVQRFSGSHNHHIGNSFFCNLLNMIDLTEHLRCLQTPDESSDR